MTPHKITTDEVMHVIKNGTEAELRTLRTALTEKKRAIEASLAEDKADMFEERRALIEQGRSLRDAVITATASTDYEWRGRAAAAHRWTDGQIVRVDTRLHELCGGPITKTVTILRGSVNDIAAQIQAHLDTGERTHGMATVFDEESGEDCVIAIFAKK